VLVGRREEERSEEERKRGKEEERKRGREEETLEPPTLAHPHSRAHRHG
jgi:hypothetical protein